MKTHHVKYLAILAAFLFLSLAGYSYLNSRPTLLLSPGEGSTAGNNFLNFYVNLSPLVSGVLVVGVIAFLILIIVESIKRVN